MATLTHYLCLQFLSLMTTCLSSLQDVALNSNTASKEYGMKMSQGQNTFLELISKGIFVDKTLLIDAFIRHPEQYLVLLRPCSWGKTINLDMLRMFFEVPLHSNGTRILPISSTPNYRLFKEGKYHSNGYNITLESPLLISQPEYSHLIEEHLGQYPVIHWSLDDIPFTNDTNEKAIVAEIIKKVYNQHRYLLTKYDRRYEDSNGIYHLMSGLNDYFKKKPIVLVDCYDRLPKAPIGTFGEIRLLLSWLTNSDYTQKTILIGTQRRDWISLNDPNVINYVSPFQTLYGFTSTEMSLIYNRYSITKQKQNLIQYWYGGYKLNEKLWYSIRLERDKARRNKTKLNETKQEIFHPSATCSYLNTLQFQSFSLDDKYNSHMKKLMNLQPSLFVFIGVLSRGATFTCCCLSVSLLTCHTRLEVEALRYAGYFIGEEFESHAIPNFHVANHLQNTLISYCTTHFDHSWSTFLNETCSVWDWFLPSGEATSYKLQINLNKCYKLLSKYYETHMPMSFRNPVPNSVKAQLSAVISIMLSKKLHFVGWHYRLHSTNRLNETNILLSCGDRGIFINIREKEDEINVVNQSSSYIQMFEQYAEFHGWKDIKFVDCQLLSYDKWEIKAIIRPLVKKEAKHL